MLKKNYGAERCDKYRLGKLPLAKRPLGKLLTSNFWIWCQYVTGFKESANHQNPVMLYVVKNNLVMLYVVKNNPVILYVVKNNPIMLYDVK